MKVRFKLVCLGNRGGMFYCKDTKTGSRTSLDTKDRSEAERLLFHKNEAESNPHINRRVGMAYLASSDPELAKRTWKTVKEDIIKDKTGATLHRYQTALKDPAYKLIEDLVLVESRPADLLEVLRSGTVSTNVYLRRFQNHALDMGWLPHAILPRKKFPKIKHKEARATTWDEHCRIIAREPNPERRDFYDLCYYLGGSQSDIAGLHGEEIDYENRSFCYSRRKTGNLGGMKIGAKAWAVILRRPRSGPLFPYLITVREADRATEFKQRCDGLGIKGVTLHSYRYSWAERGADSGYPERYAQRALGQNSKIVQRAYGSEFRVGPLVIVGFPCLMGEEFTWCAHLEAGTTIMKPAPTAPSEVLPVEFEHWLVELMRKLGPAGRTLWLMHEPPVAKPLGNASTCNTIWSAAIERFSPRLAISGHDHKSPLQQGIWHHRLGSTVCVNVGQRQNHLHYTIVTFRHRSHLEIHLQEFPGQKCVIL